MDDESRLINVHVWGLSAVVAVGHVLGNRTVLDARLQRDEAAAQTLAHRLAIRARRWLLAGGLVGCFLNHELASSLYRRSLSLGVRSDRRQSLAIVLKRRSYFLLGEFLVLAQKPLFEFIVSLRVGTNALSNVYHLRRRHRLLCPRSCTSA